MAKKTSVGGQAVIEGVMMRGEKGIATAVRKPDGEIAVKFEKKVPYTKKYKILGIPIIRGFISLIESLIIGIGTLNYSASFFEEEEDKDKKEQKEDSFIKRVLKDRLNDLIMIVSFIIAFACAAFLFIFLPTSSAHLFKKFNLVNNTIVLNIIEGIIKVIIFLLYLTLIGKMKDIKRTFEYHGAEHKTIFCYENEKELTPENAAKFTRLHPRCGTNFLFLVIIVSIFVLSFTGWGSILQRMLYRIIMLPVISGITYEFLRWMGKSKSGFSKIVSYPGLKLQNLTTREPDNSQLEVAIKALKVAEGLEPVNSDDNLNNLGDESCEV